MTVKFKRLAPLLMAELMREFGLSDWRAAAIAGNAGHESRGFTMLQEASPTVPGSRGGYGWFQWTGPRRRAFEAWAARKGLALDGYDANVGYLIHELRGPEASALGAVRQARTLEAATVAFERAYERAGVKHDDKRLRWARIALAAFRAQGANPKPLVKSRTVAGGVATGVTGVAGGAGMMIEAATTAQDSVQRASDALSTGAVLGALIALLALTAAGLVVYARWDDAGRPWPPWRRPPAPDDGPVDAAETE